jgi:hypothetical protein
VYRLKLHIGTKAERLEPAVIMDGAGAFALYVKVLSSGETRYDVSSAEVVPLPKRAFRTGDWVRRAMWSGEEEDAEVRAAAAAASARPLPRLRCIFAVARRCRALVCGATRALVRATPPARGTSHTLAQR